MEANNNGKASPSGVHGANDNKLGWPTVLAKDDEIMGPVAGHKRMLECPGGYGRAKYLIDQDKPGERKRSPAAAPSVAVQDSQDSAPQQLHGGGASGVAREHPSLDGK